MIGNNTKNHIPHSWENVPIADICDVKKDKGVEDRTPYLEIGNINIDLKNYEFTDKQSVKGCKIAKKDDVLISRVRPTRGAITFVREKDLSVSSALTILRDLGATEYKYLWFCLAWNRGFLNYLGENCTGTMYPTTSDDVVTAFPINLAPLPEQKRIVTKLEELFSELDSSIANLKRVQANLKRCRASILKAACEGKLVPSEAELARKEKRIYETGEELLQHILTERRQSWQSKSKYKEPKGPDITGLSALPEGWVWTGFEQLSNSNKHAIKAGPFGSSLKKSFYTPSGFKIYGQEQVIKGDPYFGDYYIPRELFELLQSCEVKPGDILISLVGTVGKVLILPDDCERGIINPRLVKLSLNSSAVNPKFIKFLLESSTARAFFKLAAHGGTMEILNLGILKSLPIALPPIAEQDRIIAEVERRLSIIEELESVVSTNLQRTNRLRQSILQKAFAGELVNQDPNDEPASALLERVKTLKERQKINNNSKKTARIVRRGRTKKK